MEYSDEQVFDVIVIGAGIMGSSTAYQTAKRNEKTLLLEQFDFLHQLGSSHGESRTFRATYPEDYYSPMVIQSSHLWKQAEAEIGFQVYFQTPQLDMGSSDDNSLRAVIATCTKNSIPHRLLDPPQVHQEFSGRINLPAENWVGLITQLGGVIKPTKAVSMFQTLARKHGAALIDNIKVTDLKKVDDRGGILVYTDKGQSFWGKKCVVTVGAWTKKLVESVTAGGLVLPIQPLETCVFYWKIKDGHHSDFTIGSGFPTFASYGDPYIYGTPSLEFPGLIKIPVHGGRLCDDPNRRTWVPGPKVLDSLRTWIKASFGDLVDSTNPAMTQSCLYSMTSDEDFVIDFLGGGFGKDVVMAGGFSGHGFKMGPVVGRILADLVIHGEAKGVDLKHFRLGRFEGNPKGNLKDFQDQVNSH